MVISKFCTEFFSDSVRIYYETGTVLTTSGGWQLRNNNFAPSLFFLCV